MAINNNLYPPIVDTYMPAFLKDTSPARIYFSLSAFNVESDIKNIQVSVRNQNTNLTALDTTIYPSEIKIVDKLGIDPERRTDDKYYIEINKSDMLNGEFDINQYYKVQIRFTTQNASDYPIDDSSGQRTYPLDEWLATNLDNFSEWSTVCLIRGISTPTMNINGFDPGDGAITYWANANVDILGTLTFADPAESETLKSYRIQLLDADRNLLTESGLLYSSNYNSINNFQYTLNYGLIEGDVYHLIVSYTTQNLYESTHDYEFVAVQTFADKLDAKLKYIIDEENAAIGIKIVSNEGSKPVHGDVTIRRTSSESNFTIWEDVHNFTVQDQELDYTWYDYSIESGIWYRYCAQKRSKDGQRGVIVELHEPKMILFEDMFLTGGGRQLRIQFNPQVSSFKRNVVESNTVTIGSKFPFIKRNGDVYYRSFPISGLISSQMDEFNTFSSKEEIYKGQDNIDLYNDFNKKHRITEDYDFTYEREFREKVEEYLMSNDARLFRSPTEGNIIVRLTDVNFSPNQTLGRRLWTFSATAYEVDECTVENCSKYSIQSLGSHELPITYPKTYFGRYGSDAPIPANKEVLSLLKEKYQQQAEPGYSISIDSLNYLKLEMEQKPYLIYDDGAGPYVAEPETMTVAAGNKLKNAYLGYLVYINDMPIVINPEGIYELSNDGVLITSLYFPVPTKVNIDYNADVSQFYTDTSEEGEHPVDPGEGGGDSQDARTTTFTRKNGQLFGGFSYKDSVIQQIWNKYYEVYSDYTQSLYYLNDIRVEAEPETIIYVKEDKDFDFERHVIGPTCLLDFKSENANILSLYFTGIHFHEANEYENERDTVPGFLFKETGITLDEHTLMRDYKLIRNGVYVLTPGFLEKYPEKIVSPNRIASRTMQRSKTPVIAKVNNEFEKFMVKKIENSANRYIWYNDRFWLFTEDNDLLCAVEASIDYTCDIIKERYQ